VRLQKKEERLPQLGLRNRLAIEKALPIHDIDDFKSL